jgi:CBS domain containing-hemolysin-like protein
MVGCVCFLVVGYLCAWLASDPPVPVLKGDGLHSFVMCEGPEPLWSLCLVGVEAAMLLYGLYIALCVRNVYSEFNESIHIALSIFCLSFISVIIMPISYGGLAVTSFAEYLFMSLAIIMAVTAILAMLFGPKVRLDRSV